MWGLLAVLINNERETAVPIQFITPSLRLVRSMLGITAACVMLNTPVQAADPFPTKPIQIVIPFQPGDTDAMLRPFVERMGEFLGQPLVMIYKPGAGGAVGAGFVAISKPDGYTLVGSGQSSLVVVPLANKEVKYTAESFIPVTTVTWGDSLLAVQSSSPWKTLKDLVDESRKSPGKLNFATSGVFSINQLTMEAVAKEAGVKWTHIPSQGAGPAITALLGGHVQMASSGVGPALAHIRAGTLRPLAVFGEQRLKALPDVPTLRELGYHISSPTYYGIAAPRGTSREIVEAIHGAAKKVAEKYSNEIAATLGVSGAEIKVLSPDDYAVYLKGQHDLFSAVVKTLE